MATMAMAPRAMTTIVMAGDNVDRHWDGSANSSTSAIDGGRSIMLKSRHYLSSSSVLCVEQNISVSACVSKILTDIFFYVTDIPHFTCTMMSNNLIKWCQREHLLEGIFKALRLQAAGLKLFIVSIGDLACQLCIGCSLSILSNNGTKLCVITDIFVTSYLTGTFLSPKMLQR